MESNVTQKNQGGQRMRPPPICSSRAFCRAFRILCGVFQACSRPTRHRTARLLHHNRLQASSSCAPCPYTRPDMPDKCHLLDNCNQTLPQAA